MTRGQFAPYVGLRRFDEGVGKVVGRDEAQVDSTPDLEPQVMLILVGLPGSPPPVLPSPLHAAP
jgi:hypothetical protein